MNFWDHVVKINGEWNDLPRRCAVVILVLAIMFLIAGLFPYIAPTVIAMALAYLIRPVAKLLERGFRKLRLPVKLASLIAVLVMYGAILTLMFFIAARLIGEIRSLIAAMPGLIGQAAQYAQTWLSTVQLEFASEEVLTILNSSVSQIMGWLTSQASSLAGSVAKWTLDTAMNVPQIILFVVLTIMGTFYMVADRARIGTFFQRWMPKKASDKLLLLKDTVFHGIAGQVKAALIMMALITVELSIGFTILRVPYAVLLGLAIGIMDALPILGAGLFLIPISIYGFVVGNYALGLGTAILYFLTIVSRQIVEPRVVSVQLGLYPLVTMAAMYCGLHIFGFGGMLLAPVMVLILNAALARPGDAPIAEGRVPKFHKKRKNPPAANL